MRSRLRLAGGGLLATVALLLVAGPAQAASGSISSLELQGSDVNLIFEPSTAGQTIHPGSVKVTVGGKPVNTTAVPFADSSSAAVGRQAMLVLDTSNSMNSGGRLDDAKKAAKAFVRTAPLDLSIGLMTFGNKVDLVVAPNKSHDQVTAAIDGLTTSANTVIYDAVESAVQTLGTQGSRSIILLTDGANAGSKATVEEAASAVEAAGVRLDAIGFQQSGGKAALDQLASAGNGQVYSSRYLSEVVAQFEDVAQRLSGQLLVSFPLTADVPRGPVDIKVSGTSNAGPVTAVTSYELPKIAVTPRANPKPQAADVSIGPVNSQPLLYITVAAIFLGLAATLAFAFNAAVPSGKRSVSKSLSVYTLARGQAKEKAKEPTAFGESAVAQSAVEFAGRIVRNRGFEERLQRRLEAGRVPLKPAEWIIVHVGMVVILPLLVFLLTRNLVLTILGLVVAVVGPIIYLSVKESLRRNKFIDTLPEVLQLMAGSLSAGYSLPQAIDTVVREGKDPISTEFNKALVETRLGVPIEDALETIADRMRSIDWAWVVMAIRVQREVGGNLAELLVTVAATLRERARLRRQVKVLSAEGRLSAWILGSLPVVFALYLLVARRAYLFTLGQEPLGWIMIVGGCVSLTVGALWMKRVVNVEV
jgi:tight adherence protein B